MKELFKKLFKKQDKNVKEVKSIQEAIDITREETLNWVREEIESHRIENIKEDDENAGWYKSHNSFIDDLLKELDI